METKGKFTLLNINEFISWLQKQNIFRKIITIQLHHTWSPGYKNFDGNNHFSLQESMRDYHLERGFSDIAQHFTTFPDGRICTGRSLNQIPAGIKGANTGAICIENLGNFDAGKDSMSVEQSNGIIQLAAVLVKRFGISTNSNGIVYHHWYDLVTGKRTDGKGNTKSCPGTNFFGGNSVQNCSDNFIPSVLTKMNSFSISSESSNEPILNVGRISADNLNVRSGPSAQNTIIGVLHRGVEVNCYKVKGNWWRIHPSKNHWINKNYILS